MGGKDSKLSYISHDEALKRVNEGELKRLKDAFRRVSTVSGFMTEMLFIREVLWDGVPPKIAQLLYKAFGGSSRGLSFKDLLSGLVVLTKGTQEEKVKLIFGMFADESFSYVQKDDMDRKIVAIEDQIPHALSDLFLESDQVSYEQFLVWITRHPDACIVSKWLLMEPISFSLSSDTETPTFYQTLAGVTHLEETDISELEKRYWVLKAQSKTGRFDQETFKSFVSPPMPETLCEALFMAFDENRDNHIDFKEIACGISACCRGPQLERQKFCFKIFDTNHDGKLDHSELQEMIDCMVAIRMENKPLEELESDAFLKLDPSTVAKEILSCHDTDKDGCITLEEYLVWTVKNVLCDDFLDLISQICHVVLGLKPQTKEEEGKIIIDWLERENRKKREVGQVWYLVCMQWWNSWKSYVNFKPPDSNGVLPQSRSNSTDTRNRHAAQQRSLAGSIPWDDETVVVVNVNSTSSVSDTTLVAHAAQPGNISHISHFSNTFPRTSHAVNGSPRKYHLAPDVNGRTRSPSPSPKLHKKLTGVHSAPKPGQIDNNSLIVPNPQKVLTLTNEGGRLKRDVFLTQGKDFELVPEPVWRALSSWYGGSPALPRTVIPSTKGDPNPELELYPVMVRLLRHQTQTQRPVQTTTFTSMVSGIGGMAISTMASFSNNQQPRRYLAFVACFSRCHTMQQVYDFLCNKLRFTREDMRLWKVSSKDENNTTLLDDENLTVEEAGLEDNQQVLIEVRNKDLTWPEEMSQLAKNKTIKKDHVPTDPGATGLNNLGNTCFMNAALQCVSNTWPLTKYFTTGFHLYELNRTNPLGMKGHIAQRYGELVKDMWSGSTKTTAPLKLRWTIGKYAPRFNGFQQHDSQELLSFLLDGLHEDLNRVHDKPYVELKDSDGRPDEIVAQEAWDNHMLRNQSVIVDLFHGQLKSQVRCKQCGHVSVKFDPFNYLSLPLPMDSCIHLEIIVMKLDGTVPIKYGVRLNMDEKYKMLKKALSELTDIPTNQILLVEILGPVVKTLPQDNQKIRNLMGGSLYAYELPPLEEIEPITAEEELAEKKSVSVGLNEIQRGVTTPKKMSAGSLQSGKLQPVLNGLDSSSNSNTPTHSRNNSNTSLNVMVSPSSGASIDSMSKSVGDVFNGFVIGVHRKMTLMDLYFLSSQKTRPSLFGTPIIIPCNDKATNQELYQFVWTQVARLVSPLPPSEMKSTNHAQDCDDSLGYEYPFTLKVVQKDGFTCAWCPWYRFCRGCRIECNTEDFNFGSSFVAIDWEPTALHLRYQTTCERFFEEHDSVPDSRKKQTEPIDLDTCLQAFTKEEELGEDELYYCSKCKKHCLASKKLDIWRLPPVLIVNLKRFQFLNGRWVKSHKIVKFPLENFDPSCYLAPRKQTVSKNVICNCNNPSDQSEDSHHDNSSPGSQSEHCCHGNQQSPMPNAEGDNVNKVCDKNNPVSASPARRKYSLGEVDSPAHRKRSHGESDGPVRRKHSHGEIDDDVRSDIIHSNNNATSLEQECSNPEYKLFAMSCHTGILGGGHYVAFAKNPNKKWYCYNDSSCKEVQVNQLDTNAAYILFYQREGVDFHSLMPDITDKTPDKDEIDDEVESEFKKLCVIQ